MGKLGNIFGFHLRTKTTTATTAQNTLTYEPLKDKTNVMPKVFIRKIRVTTVEARLFSQYYEINYDSNKNKNNLNGFNLEIAHKSSRE